jgi:hypothetical protein
MYNIESYNVISQSEKQKKKKNVFEQRTTQETDNVRKTFTVYTFNELSYHTLQRTGLKVSGRYISDRRARDARHSMLTACGVKIN